jgi:hypothetical protein
MATLARLSHLFAPASSPVARIASAFAEAAAAF